MAQRGEADTLEQANAILSFEGEKGEESQNEGGNWKLWYKTEHLWDLGDGTKITGEFSEYPSDPEDNDLTYVDNIKAYVPHRAKCTGYFWLLDLV